jgi:hypothetical protein
MTAGFIDEETLTTHWTPTPLQTFAVVLCYGSVVVGLDIVFVFIVHL